VNSLTLVFLVLIGIAAGIALIVLTDEGLKRKE
jgi:hypothetical protein